MEGRKFCNWAQFFKRTNIQIAGCVCTRNAGNVLPLQTSVSDPDMDHGTCVSHVPWCMSGAQTRSGRETIPGIPGAYATRNFTYLARGP